MDLDAYQEKIGGISKYQIAIIVSVGWISFGAAFSSQAAIFISATPEHRCLIPIVDNNPNSCNLTNEEIDLLFISYDTSNQEYSSCYRYDYNFTNCMSECDIKCIENQTKVDDAECDYGFVYDTDVYGETTITQFDLVCDRRYLDTIAQTLFFLGFFIGSAIVGPLCDWTGRKTAVLVISTGYMITSVSSAFLPSYELYAVFRVLVGTFSVSTFIAVFTYATEISSTKRRTEAGTLVNLSSGFAHTAYAGIAYFVRGWRYLQLIIGLAPLPIVFLYFLLPETPRWLLTNKKIKEARKVVGRYAKSKNATLSDEDWDLILKTENQKSEQDKLEGDTTEKVSIWDLFRRPLMRILCFNVMFSWFTISMVFYGLALNGGNLAGDPYLNNALNALVEIFAYMCLYFAAVFGRRIILALGCILAGLFCISSMLCDWFSNGNWGFPVGIGFPVGNKITLLTTSTVFAIIGKFFASNAFALIYIATSEIFPTNARATGISLGSMAARVGGMLSPLMLQIQVSVPWFTQTVFGILSVIAGLLSLMYPETSKIDYISTMDEAEQYYKENMTILTLCKNKQRLSSSSESYEYEDSKSTIATSL